MSIHAADVAEALACQVTAKRTPGCDPYHGGNLHITGLEERRFILDSLSCDDEDENMKEAFVQWTIQFRDVQRSLWKSELAVIEASLL